MTELILYRTEDGRVWLTQDEIAELFTTTKQNVSLHARNISKEGELLASSVVKESLTTAAYAEELRELEAIEKAMQGKGEKK